MSAQAPPERCRRVGSRLRRRRARSSAGGTPSGRASRHSSRRTSPSPRSHRARSAMRARSTSWLRGARQRRGRARLRPRAGRLPLRALRRAAARRRLGRDDRPPLALRDRRLDPHRDAQGLRLARARRASPRRSTARRPTTACTPRCGPSASRDEPRFEEAVAELWPYALGVLEPEPARAPGRARRARAGRAGRARRARGRLRRAARGDDDGAPLGAGRDMVTAEKVWDALAEIPDPEIPVDLARRPRRRARGRGGAAIASASSSRRRSSAAPRRRSCATRWPRPSGRSAPSREIDVVLDDSWSTDRITAGGPAQARGVRLRAAAPARRRPARRSSSSRRRPSAARTAARATRAWRTSSARLRAARSATARAAGSRSSSSRRSER